MLSFTNLLLSFELKITHALEINVTLPSNNFVPGILRNIHGTGNLQRNGNFIDSM